MVLNFKNFPVELLLRNFFVELLLCVDLDRCLSNNVSGQTLKFNLSVSTVNFRLN